MGLESGLAAPGAPDASCSDSAPPGSPRHPQFQSSTFVFCLFSLLEVECRLTGGIPTPAFLSVSQATEPWSSLPLLHLPHLASLRIPS